MTLAEKTLLLHKCVENVKNILKILITVDIIVRFCYDSTVTSRNRNEIIMQ